METSCGANGRRFQKPVMSVQCFDDTFCGRAHNDVYPRKKETLKLMGVILKHTNLTTGCFHFFPSPFSVYNSETKASGQCGVHEGLDKQQFEL